MDAKWVFVESAKRDGKLKLSNVAKVQHKGSLGSYEDISRTSTNKSIEKPKVSKPTSSKNPGKQPWYDQKPRPTNCKESWHSEKLRRKKKDFKRWIRKLLKDIWDCKTQESYCSLTIHFLKKDFK